MAVREPEPATQPRVSAVVAVHDEAAHIEACLRTLLAQSYPSFEVIVVDDCSRDGTAEVVGRFPGLRLVALDRQVGAAAARNAGAAAATGEILVFLDGDMEFPPEFLDRMVAPMLVDPSVRGTFTREIVVANGHKRWARNHMLGRFLPADNHFPDDFPDRWDIYRALWRRDFQAVGGFDVVGHGEDVTLGRKIGDQAHVAPGAVIRHHEPEDLRDIWRSAAWYGRGIRIAEQPGFRRRFLPWHTARRAAALVMRHRYPSLVVYRLVWDAGVLWGGLTRSGRRAVRK